MASPQPHEVVDDLAPDDAVERSFLDMLAEEDGDADEAPEEPKKVPAKGAPDEEAEADDEPVEEESEEAEKPEDEPAEDEGIQTLADIAKHFEVDEGALAEHLQVKVGDQAMSLAEVIKAASEPIDDRVEAGVKAKLAEYTPKRDAELAALEEARKGLVATAERLVAESEVLFRDVNWQELERSDPAEYAQKYVLREKYRHLVGESLGRLQADRDARAKEEKDREDQWAAEQHRALLARPEFKHWSDPDKAKGDLEALGTYLLKAGFDKQDVEKLIDSRMVLVAWKAMQHDKNKARTFLAKEKVSKAPKAAIRGAREAKVDPKFKRRATLTNRLRKSGKAEDAAALFLDDGTLDDVE